MSHPDQRFYLKRVIEVRLACTGDMINQKDVKMVNIEEGFDGSDLVTFICPFCEEHHTSMRYMNYE